MSKIVHRFFPSLVAVLTVLVVVVAVLIVTTVPAKAAVLNPTFGVINMRETLPDGIWFRYDPYTADTDRVNGHGVNTGDMVKLSCYMTGQAVGAYNNKLWYYVSNVTRPTVPSTGAPNVGFLNAHYINDGKAANVVDPGVPACLINPHWAGYAVYGHRYNDVKGTWVVPSVHCSLGQNSDSVVWVGLDSVPHGPVEQIGTGSACRNGKPTYYVWYELTPANAVVLRSIPISPGDTITGEVSTNFDGKFTLTLHNVTKGNTQGWPVNKTKIPSIAGTAAGGYSAECIVERPIDYGGTPPLANFGIAKFSSCTVNGVTISQVFSTHVEILLQSGSTIFARTSNLGSDGKSFSVTWNHS